MCDTGSEHPFTQAESLDQSQTHAPASVVTLDYHKLEQVAFRVGDNFTILYRSFLTEMLRGNLPRLDAYDFDIAIATTDA